MIDDRHDHRKFHHWPLKGVVGCGVWLAIILPSLAQNTIGGEKRLEQLPSYNGSLHLVGTMGQRDVRSKADKDKDIVVVQEAVTKNAKDHHLSDNEVKQQVSQALKGFMAEMSRKDRTLELWAKGPKWVLVEIDPTAKTDVFSGKDVGKTVWLCDGTDLLKIEDSGFKCTRFPPKVRMLGQFPAIPPLGINYSPMPSALASDAPPEIVAKVKLVPGWTLANVPSFTEFHDDETVTYERESNPTHFTNYNPGFVKLEQSAGSSRTAEIRVGTIDLPMEQWTFGDYRLHGGVTFAHVAVWRDFESGSMMRPRLQRTFKLKSVDTGDVDDALLSRDHYLKNGALIAENMPPPNRPKTYFYHSGASWEDMSIKSNPIIQSSTSLVPGILAACITLVGATCVFTFRQLKRR